MRPNDSDGEKWGLRGEKADPGARSMSEGNLGLLEKDGSSTGRERKC